MHSERNDKIRYHNGAYIDIEHHLLRLALVSEIVPRANKKYVSDIPSPVRLPPTAVESRFDRPKPPKKDEKKEKTSKLFGLTFQKSKTEKKKKDESPTKKMAKGCFMLLFAVELFLSSFFSKNIYTCSSRYRILLLQ